ncbi:glycosyltransferase [Paenibacillus gallinarum]|uniref:Glycosyltransferase n=1 Tax=Paenibacillus gallinarum TaxID=2762232 RepID=A0ABR8T0W2_9BACL|nr:glycosyltransferase [Paenibacillus gallinarum]MBD7968939.1 glycosyltransferase [Paenibacillus gallinarum]
MKITIANNGDKLNILQLYDNFMLGGAETHIVSLSKGLKDLGHNVVIASAMGTGIDLIRKANLTFVECPLNIIEEQISAIAKVVEIITNYKIDVIHTHPYNSQIVGVLAGRITKKPVITTIHGTYKTPVLYEPFKSQISSFIAISNEVVKYMNKEYKVENINCLPNSVLIPKVNLLQERKSKAEKIRIVYISRMDSDKFASVLFLLMAVPTLALTIKKGIEVTLVGDGDKFDFIKSYVGLLNKNMNKEIVKVIGGSTNVQEIMQESDVVIGVGRVILEGVSYKKSVICIGNNNYPGLIDALKLKGISEVNFTDRNTSTPLSIEKFIEDIKIVEKLMETNNNEMIEDNYQYLINSFSIERIAVEHQKVYISAISKSRNKPEIKLKKMDQDFNYSMDLKIKQLLINNSSRNDNNDYDESGYFMLISPFFDNPKDKWLEVIEYIFDLFEDHPKVSIIIRIQNKYNSFSMEIINILNKLIAIKNNKVPNIIINNDLYQNEDEATALLLLRVKGFVPTNNDSLDTMTLCKIVGVDIIDTPESMMNVNQMLAIKS